MAGTDDNYSSMFSFAEFDHNSNSQFDAMFDMQGVESGSTGAGLNNANCAADGTSSGDQKGDDFQAWLDKAVEPFGNGHFDQHQFELRVGQDDNITRERTDYQERYQTNYYDRPTGRSTIFGIMAFGINGLAALNDWFNKPHATPQESQSVLGKRPATSSESFDRDHESSAKRIRNEEGGYFNVGTGPGTDFNFEDDMVCITSHGISSDHNANNQARRGHALNRVKKSAVRKFKRTWNN